MDPSQQGGGHPYPPYRAQPPHQQFPGYPVPPAVQPVNGLSIASLVLGLVCCLPPLGMVFGFIALVQIRKKGERGKGMAIAGTSLSAVSTLLLVVVLATGGFGEMWDGVKKGVDQASRQRSTLDLRTGDCFNLPGAAVPEEQETAGVEVVDCDLKHEAEVSGGFEVTGFDDYPGESRLDTLAGKRCQEINDAYALDAWDRPKGMDAYYYLPTDESWRLGDSAVTCSFASVSGAKVTGSLRRDATSLNPHQLAYLNAESAVIARSGSEPEEEFPEDAQGHRDWARQTSATLAAQARALREHAWPAAVATAAERRAGEFDRARAHWDKAARAQEEDSFWDHALQGEDTLVQATEVSVRRALGLKSVPPPDDSGA
ncbi:DUF4190 domain-containing protein [Streptomyces sp. NPDC006475]|uniref:DUF4190 domain-containing protein n=1 Tax=Streptomyces sp. NPDC006475 TaxID=3155719 RepID=UPI0033A54302